MHYSDHVHRFFCKSHLKLLGQVYSCVSMAGVPGDDYREQQRGPVPVRDVGHRPGGHTHNGGQPSGHVRRPLGHCLLTAQQRHVSNFF